jgi:hypothetical protein
VTDAMVAGALKHHAERPEGFQPHETVIRDTFDRFLDGLERFASFRAAKLVTADDIRPYLAYWIHHVRSAQGVADDAHRLCNSAPISSSTAFEESSDSSRTTWMTRCCRCPRLTGGGIAHRPNTGYTQRPHRARKRPRVSRAGHPAGRRRRWLPRCATVRSCPTLADPFAYRLLSAASWDSNRRTAVGRLRQGGTIDAPTYIDRRRELDQMRHAAPGLFTRVDLLVTPTVPLLPALIAEARDDDAGGALYARNARPFNMYGLPAVTVPCGFATNGLPIGLRIVGPPWGEESVLRLAHAYEPVNCGATATSHAVTRSI